MAQKRTADHQFSQTPLSTGIESPTQLDYEALSYPRRHSRHSCRYGGGLAVAQHRLAILPQLAVLHRRAKRQRRSGRRLHAIAINEGNHDRSTDMVAATRSFP